jgi:hypothetical protein
MTTSDGEGGHCHHVRGRTPGFLLMQAKSRSTTNRPRGDKRGGHAGQPVQAEGYIGPPTPSTASSPPTIEAPWLSSPPKLGPQMARAGAAATSPWRSRKSAAATPLALPDDASGGSGRGHTQVRESLGRRRAPRCGASAAARGWRVRSSRR